MLDIEDIIKDDVVSKTMEIHGATDIHKSLKGYYATGGLVRYLATYPHKLTEPFKHAMEKVGEAQDITVKDVERLVRNFARKINAEPLPFKPFITNLVHTYIKLRG